MKKVIFGKGNDHTMMKAETYEVSEKKRIFDVQDHMVIGYRSKFEDNEKRKNIKFIQDLCKIIYDNIINEDVKKNIINRGPLYMIDKNPYKLKEFDDLIDRNNSYKKKTGFAENSPLPGFINMSTFYDDEEIDECIITHEYGHTIYHSLPNDLHKKWERLYNIYNIENDEYNIDAWIFKRNPSECFSEVLQIYLNVTHRGYATGGIFYENMRKKIPKMYKFMKKLLHQTPEIVNLYNAYDVIIEDTTEFFTQ